MMTTLRKWLSVLLSAVLMLLLFATGCTGAPDYTAFTNTEELLQALELTDADLLPAPDSALTFRAVDPGKSSAYHLTFTTADPSEKSFDLWAENLREKTKELDLDGYCRVVHNTGGIKDEEPHDSHHRWYITYSAEKSIKYLAYRTDDGAFALKIQFAW